MNSSHGLVFRLQEGSDTEVLVLLEPFGLGEVHIKSFFGKFLQQVQSNSEWLKKRKAVECERDSQR
jgi:hypothetical protein